MGESQQSRFEKSLGLLTTKFVNLLQKSTGGVLDLKLASIMSDQFSNEKSEKNFYFFYRQQIY